MEVSFDFCSEVKAVYYNQCSPLDHIPLNKIEGETNIRTFTRHTGFKNNPQQLLIASSSSLSNPSPKHPKRPNNNPEQPVPNVPPPKHPTIPIDRQLSQQAHQHPERQHRHLQEVRVRFADEVVQGGEGATGEETRLEGRKERWV